jgi:hypothetical protein
VPNIYTQNLQRQQEDNAGLDSGLHYTQLAPRRPGSMKAHINTRRSTRESSFQPELDSIVSSRENSDGDSPPELSGSVESQDSLERIELARTRESCDDRFSGYLLELAAKAAEKQIKEREEMEQVLAAFPNEYSHEIVEHYYGGDSEDEAVEGTGMLVDDVTGPAIQTAERKTSDMQGGWDLNEMRAHQETINKIQEPAQAGFNDMLAKVRQAAHERLKLMQEAEKEKKAAEALRQSLKDKDPFGNEDKASPFYSEEPEAGAAPSAAELKAMRAAASPPMLGGDLIFRTCPSPKASKFESDQRPDIQPNRSLSGHGLWGGYCVSDEAGQFLSPAVTRDPAMIQTPTIEHEDPFSFAFSAKVPKSPKTRDSGVGMLASIHDRVKSEVARSKQQESLSKQQETLLAEFDDDFVTQVYNYLSLGYPSLARPFDMELAKISRIPEEELRVDDRKGNAKGYLAISDPKFGNGTSKNSEKQTLDHHNYCARWKALRIYITEWARQHPNLSNGVGTPGWGVRARRGSWAI